jgi:hypothetical protein
MIQRTTGLDVRVVLQQDLDNIDVTVLRSHPEAGCIVRASISNNKHKKWLTE